VPDYLAASGIDVRRAMIAGLDLTFHNSPARYDSRRDLVTSTGDALGASVACAISGEMLDRLPCPASPWLRQVLDQPKIHPRFPADGE